MSASICETCESNRCGNHAACARKKAAERAAKQWWSEWRLVWLYVGAYHFLGSFTAISDDRERKAFQRVVFSATPTAMLHFTLYATSSIAVERRRSWLMALDIIEGRVDLWQEDRKKDREESPWPVLPA